MEKTSAQTSSSSEALRKVQLAVGGVSQEKIRQAQDEQRR